MRLEQLCRDVSHTRNHDVGGTGRHGKAREAILRFEQLHSSFGLVHTMDATLGYGSYMACGMQNP